jgi:5-methylcytosine-specific restriction endonuclease McrA
MKRCSRCGETKPHSEFHKQKRSRDGLQSYCRECTKAYAKAHYEANAEQIKAKNRAYCEAKNPDRVKKTAARRALAEQGMKPCLDCNEVKPFGEFSPNKRTRDGLHSYCRTCEAARVRASRKKYPERARARERRKGAVRRAREAGMRVFEISPKDQRSLDLGACAHAHLGGCKGAITGDHVIPVSKPGSSHGIGNFQALCFTHNSSKKGKWEVEARYATELAALKARKRALVKEAA